MFVWALRDKGSEWRTVRRFLARGRLPFMPLVEAVCEPFIARTGNVQDPIRVINKLSANISPLTDSGRAWIDLNHLLQVFSASDVAELHRSFRGNRQLSYSSITPVIRVSSPPPVMEEAFRWAVEERSGLGIRVDGLTRLTEKAAVVREASSASGLRPDMIDLILDAQDLPRAVGHEEMAAAFPIGQLTRTYAVLGGTFPQSITQMTSNTYEYVLERGEWTTWTDEMEREGQWRRPLYGDYATQPANYIPSPPFPGSPSVRYTTGDAFVILRGRGAAPGQGADFSQYIGHARYLRQQPYYCDVVATPGDGYFEQVAAHANGSGNATTWRIASLERHIGVVSAQVARFDLVTARA